ncbi:MAG TPA: hypothetical protein DCZ13_10490 [Porticoccaceae bacterium]|nr:hypothetical protein [Porticoccaceae bacterium]
MGWQTAAPCCGAILTNAAAIRNAGPPRESRALRHAPCTNGGAAGMGESQGREDAHLDMEGRMNNLLAMLAANADNGRMILRVVTGIIMFLAGYTKVFVWGLGNVQNAFANMGILLPQVAGPFVALLELIAGLMLVAGLFTRHVAVLFFIQFIVATYVVWASKGFVAARLEIILLVVFLMLATNGSGPLSIDRNIRKRD